VHYSIESRDERAMRITIGSRLCRKCGATIPPDAPQQSCGACLLETGLGFLGEDGKSDAVAAPMLMDFGDYELLEQIGRGGQGVVFRARQKSLNRTVALKVIALGHWATEGHIKRFRLEAEAAASLDHPQIVPIYDIGERDGSCYFSMKFVEGGQLDSFARREPLAIRRSVELIAKLARTVQYAHDRGILHRDIKPGNILLDGAGEPNLTDFGLARLVETESNVTRTMEVLGTPSYMAPEEAAGQTKQLTAATDVYGLGAVFYQLLTGHPPFAGGTTYETIRMVLETEPRKPRLWNPKVDRDLETICLKCLEKDPKKRYASALELAEDLEHWSRHEPIRARRSGLFSRGRKWVRRNPATALLAPALLGLVVLASVMLWNREPAPPPTGIAVLPFQNLSDEKENALLADGVQDDILTKLAKVGGLKVISRTSVMQYRGERNVRKIGNALRVSHVLEGSVRKTGDRIHLNVQLIDARTDSHVWAEQYDRDLPELFAMQSEIARTIANQLSANISGAEKKAIEAKPTGDLQAYEMYLRAKELMHSTSTNETGSVDIYSRAVNLLEKAVARDPNFALAYCLLVEANLSLHWRYESVLGARERAEVALQAARRLAPEAGETHLAEALFFYWGNRDYDRALESLEQAARSLPNSAIVFSLSARVEQRLGRWAEALRHSAKAVELDPRDWQLRDAQIVAYILVHNYAEVDRAADRAIADYPERANYYRVWKADAALSKGDLKAMRAHLATVPVPDREFWWQQWNVAVSERNYSEAENVLNLVAQHHLPDDPRYPRIWFEAVTARAEGQAERARVAFEAARQHYTALLRDRQNEQPMLLSQLAIVDAMLGRKEEALQEGRRAVGLLPISHDAVEGPRMAANLAIVYSLIGERDRAIEQLSSVVKLGGEVTYGEFKFAPWWDELRSDPRFNQILAEAAKPIPLN
jgi:serine/threonine protein kinase/tetratricopeptide (TPR) repeat protein